MTPPWDPAVAWPGWPGPPTGPLYLLTVWVLSLCYRIHRHLLGTAVLFDKEARPDAVRPLDLPPLQTRTTTYSSDDHWWRRTEKAPSAETSHPSQPRRQGDPSHPSTNHARPTTNQARERDRRVPPRDHRSCEQTRQASSTPSSPPFAPPPRPAHHVSRGGARGEQLSGLTHPPPMAPRRGERASTDRERKGASVGEILIEACRRDNVDLLKETLEGKSEAEAADLLNKTTTVMGNHLYHEAAARGNCTSYSFHAHTYTHTH